MEMTRQEEIAIQAFVNFKAFDSERRVKQLEKNLAIIEKEKEDKNHNIVVFNERTGKNEKWPKETVIKDIRNCISYVKQQVTEIRKNWENIKVQDLKDFRGHEQPIFLNLNSGKGYLRILSTIKSIRETQGKNPTHREINEYLRCKFGLTGRNNETISALTHAKFIESCKGYQVTELGEELLKAYGC